MNVANLLRAHAERTPDKCAILDLTSASSMSLTYRDLEMASARAASVLRKAGLKPGARILVLYPMSSTLYVTVAGILRAGMVPVFCDPAAGREYFARACAMVSPDAVFAGFAGHLYAATIPGAYRRKRLTPQHLIAKSGSDLRSTSSVVERRGDDAAIITFTSGSTGLPKAIVRTHALLAAQLTAIREMLPASEIEIVTMPVVALANLASGSTTVIPGVNLRRPGKANPRDLARDIEKTGATSIVASPAMFERLTSAEFSRMHSLRRIVTGGGPVMPSLVSTLRSGVPHADIFGVYGSSEAEPIACLPFASVTDRDFRAMRDGAGILAGLPTARTSVRIVNGEIVVAGEHVVLEGRPWHGTGDGGYLDRLGRLWLTGRVQSAIGDDRGRMEPLRVECALSFDRAITRSALTGMRGRRIVFVQPVRGKRIAASTVKARAAWASIDEVRVVRRLPVDRRHNAKIDYAALRQMVRA